MVGIASSLALHAARPPTPPKESTAKLPGDILNGFYSNAANRPLIDTPEESPSSSADYFKSSQEKGQKKVGFSPWTQYHRALNTNGKDSDSEGSIRRLPPSRDCKSSKSILKPNLSNSSSLECNDDMLAFDNSNFSAMLRSTTQHLASASRASRLDGYSALLACLGAYEDIPQEKDLSEKVVEITGYIRRDVAAKTEEDGVQDIQLATPALKLLTVFLCTPTLVVMLPEEFCSFIIERSVSSIDDGKSPKILVSHFMHLIGKQKFTNKIVTPDRVNRLLSALDGVTNRIKGNRVVGHRLMIYQRLLAQAKPTMISRVGSWIDHLIAGMLSTIRDIRARAIAFGIEASLQLGTVSSVSQACTDVFNRESPEGKKVIDFLCSRLNEMAISKEDGVHVPQIWSVVILFFRSRRRQLEYWEHLKAWLVIIQRCFNSSEAQVKFQANIAWSRLIFAIDLDISTTNSMAKMLRQPIMTQLERKSNDKSSKHAKQIAWSSYCTILYYAFRPSATHDQLDLYWDLYVSQIVSSCFTSTRADAGHACEILAALLSGNGKPTMWDQNRANLSGPMKPSELPCLDPKWIRLRTATVLQLFDKLLDLADWQPANDEEAPVISTWRAFVAALGNASSKEVKVSRESLTAVACIITELNFFLERNASNDVKDQDYQLRDSPCTTTTSDLYFKINYLIQEAVANIGPLPFLERRIIQTSQNSFEATETPSSRTSNSSRNHGTLHSPAMHLLKVLLLHIPDGDTTTNHIAAVKFVISIPLQSTTSRQARLSILRSLGQLLSTESTLNLPAKYIFWQLLAEATASALRSQQQTDSHSASSQHPGQDYRNAVKILELGIQQQSLQSSGSWIALLECIIKALSEEIGDQAIMNMVTEPLAGLICKEVRRKLDDRILDISIAVLRFMNWPQSRQLVERAQKRLWGMVHLPHKSNLSDTFDNLCSMIGTLLGEAYPSLGEISYQLMSFLISALTECLQSSPSSLGVDVVVRIQQGLSLWIEDASGVLDSSRPESHGLSVEIKTLWSAVLTIIKGAPTFNGPFLSLVQNIFISGLRSRHRAIVNECVVAWNQTFAQVESLEYPQELRTILLNLENIIDLELPNLSKSDGDEVMSSPIHFIDSQGSVMERDQPSNKSPHQDQITESPSLRPKKFSTRIANSPELRVSDATRSSPHSVRREAKTTPKVRLRHNDSQIQFAAIESSPLDSEPIDSQHLTTRQKEIKERQGLQAAAMFPEIRSSSRSSSRPPDVSLPKLVYRPDEQVASNSIAAEDTSPAFPPDALMNDFIGSSPTPSSGRKRVRDGSDDNDPPSSPPLISSHLKINAQTDVPAVYDERAQVQDHERCPDNNYTPRTGTSDNGISPVINEKVVESSTINRGVPQDVDLARSAHLNLSDAHIPSDADIFVDASTEPPVNQSSNVQDDTEVSQVLDSFQSEGSSHFSTEEDQITAQLVSEIEHASQQSKKPELDNSTNTKKRKRCFDSSPDANKKPKHLDATVDKRKPNESVAECVMIDVREVSPYPSVIKAERSPSPILVHSTPLEPENPDSEKRPVGRPRTSKANQRPSKEKPSVRRSARQMQVKQEHDQDATPRAVSSPASARRSRHHDGDLRISPETPTSLTRQERRVSASASTSAIGNFLKGRIFGNRLRRTSEVAASQNPQVNSQCPGATEGNDKLKEQHRKNSKVPVTEAVGQVGGKLPESQVGGTEPADQAGADDRSEAGSVFETEGERPTAPGLLKQFRDMLDNIKRVSLRPEEERAMVGVLFESVKEVHDAGRRHSSM